METIGLIGGMSWESSLEYYRIVNQAVKEKLGGFHSAKCVIRRAESTSSKQPSSLDRVGVRRLSYPAQKAGPTVSLP